MRRRIAHRPRYKNTQQCIRTPLTIHQNLFPVHWIYRRQQPIMERHALGHGLASLVPPNYRLAQYIVVYPI